MLLKLLKGDFSGLENLKNQIINLSQAGQSLKNLNTSINNINKISQDIFTANGINTTSIDLYRKSLEGLTIEQKALALSTSSLTEAEIKEMLTRQDNAIVTNAISESEAEAIISKMGLITTTQLLSETELEELGTRVGLEAQTIKNALIETGLVTVKNGDVITTKELTEAELEEALTSEGAALADKKQTAQIIAETIAKKTNIGITKQYAGNTNLLIGAFDKLKTVIATHPILTFATILGAGIYAIKKYKDSIDSLIESGKNITSEYESKVNDLHENQSEFSTLATRYSELSDGVNSLGQNVSLTSDEFSEYKDIVNKIGDLSPNLIKGYSDEGDAILKIKDNVEALTEAYNQNIIAANNSILSNARTVTEAANKSEVKYSAKDSSKYQVEGLEGLLNGTLSASDVMSRYRDTYSGGLYGYEYKDLTELLNSLGIDVGFTKDDEFWTSESEANEFNKKLETTLNNLNSDQRNILQGYITRRNSEYEEIFKGSRDILKANIENAILTDNDLQNLPEELKTTLLNISDSLDVEIFKKYNSPEELAQYASTITDVFKTLSSTQQEDIEMGINLSTQWNNDELSYDDYIAKVQEFVNLLETLFPDNKEIVESFKILFDIPDEEELAKQQDIFVNRLGEKAVSSKNASTVTSDSNSILDNEKQKLVDWGKEVGKDYTQFEDDIESGVLHKFGNVDMDKRAIITWSKEMKETYQKELASWEYDPEIGSIDTVWGQSTAFEWDDQEHEIAFTPIMETEDGAVFLGEKEVYDYINSVITKAGEDGEITADEIFKIDAVETGKQYGEQFGKGLIAGVDESTGNVGIDAIDAGNLMHFSGKYGAIKLAKDSETIYGGASKAGMPSDVENRLKSQGTEVADAWYDSLTKSQREFVDNVSDEDLAEAVKFDSTQEFDEWLEKLQEEANENEIEVKTKYSESVATLDSMEDSFGDNLSTLYTTTVTNSDKASASEIEDVNSDFGGVTFDEEDISNVNTMSNAIERFNQDLIENAGDSEAAQTSMDKLATAYVDQSGVLDGLLDNLDDITDAEKDYYIQQLKANGITNAEEVVNSRLSKQYQKTSKALTDLSKKIAQNRSALDKGVEAGEEYDTAISNIESSVTDLLTTYNDNGDAIFIPEVDSSFITSNLEDIYAATEGDIDALERLRIAAARANAASVMIDVDLPSEVVESQLDSIMDKVSQVDDMDIEVGAYVEDAQFLSELSNMMSSSQSTANAVAAAFESMGYSVEWKDNPHTITYTEAQISGVEAYSTSAAAAMKQHNVEVNMPSLSIKRTSTGSTGSSVNYGGGTSSSSSSGGGSDSGSDSDSSEDTFDWVEVAISRLESEIERLDEIVDNTYETWGKRNEALKNQIEDVTDEIELQSVAAKRYLAEANSVGLSDEYKKKVQEGTIDIETITDEDLAEDINDYQTYWENYQDAMDQIQTLTFELQGYYKELFEQIESEYDDLLTNIEKKNDIIEERITRTEEHGYFVDKKYYEEQLKLEKQNNDELINERERLVNTMNLAISEGKIKSGSETWNEMYQSIMDVNKAIEESYTNTVKLNNALRQLKWDAFDWVEERISDVSAEADFLIKILQGELNYEDNGEFTNRGFAQAALVGAKYDDTLKKAQRYRDEILKINEDLAKDPNDKNLIERKEELVQAYRDAIEAAEDEKQAMKSLVEEAFNIKVSYLVISRK